MFRSLEENRKVPFLKIYYGNPTVHPLLNFTPSVYPYTYLPIHLLLTFTLSVYLYTFCLPEVPEFFPLGSKLDVPPGIGVTPRVPQPHVITRVCQHIT